MTLLYVPTLFDSRRVLIQFLCSIVHSSNPCQGCPIPCGIKYITSLNHHFFLHNVSVSMATVSKVATRSKHLWLHKGQQIYITRSVCHIYLPAYLSHLILSWSFCLSYLIWSIYWFIVPSIFYPCFISIVPSIVLHIVLFHYAFLWVRVLPLFYCVCFLSFFHAALWSICLEHVYIIVPYFSLHVCVYCSMFIQIHHSDL